MAQWFDASSTAETITAQGQRRRTADAVSGLRAWLGSIAATRVLLILILLVGGYLRLSHVNWDMGTHIHPDERFLTMVEAALKLPESVGEFLDSTRSPLNPYNVRYADGSRQFPLFVYGTLPIFIVRIVAEIANEANQSAVWWTNTSGIPINLTGYDGVHFVGRTLSGLFDLGGVWLIFVIGRRLYGRRVGLLAAALLAFAVLPLQQSHFFTVDTFGTFFSLLTFYFAVRVAQGAEPDRRGGGWGSYLALGASLGASVACRINLAPIAAIAVLAAGIRLWDDWHAGIEGDSRGAVWLNTLAQATLFRLVLMGLTAIAVFRAAQPYAFGGTSVLDFSFADHWLDNMRYIQRLMAGDIDSPPGHQWANRTPFVFPFVNMVVWGMGIPLGVAAWTGWAVAAWQIARGVANSALAQRARPHLLPIAWIGGMFLWQGLQYVQSMRYLLPIYPLLAMMAAWLLFYVLDLLRGRFAALGYALIAAVTIGTMLWGWGFLAIYRRPLTRVTASRWIYANVPEDSRIANEHWDDGLPLSIDGKIGFRPYGPYWGLSSSSDGQMQMYAEDTPEKRELLYGWLNEADYIVLSSNRLYDSISRLPMRYPMTTLYYRLLFEEKLGFRQALKVSSFPTILGVEFDDTGAEEAFSVYDHPVVYIFEKTPAYSEENVRRYLDAVDLENTIQMWPKQVSAAPTALLLTPDEAERQQAGGTWSSMFRLDSIANRFPALVWLLLVEALGLIAFPLAFLALRSLSDRGYGVSKVLGVLLLAWLSWLAPSLGVAAYTRGTIAVFLVLLAVLAVALVWRWRSEMWVFIQERRSLLLAEEGIFLVLFLAFLFIRWANPDLWHPARGGEKPMDFAYLNAVIKSTTFPAYDPWFAGGFLNYYYFGFVIVGTLVKLAGIVPWVAYNLIVPTLFALTGLGSFAVVYSLLEGDPEVAGERQEEIPLEPEPPEPDVTTWGDQDEWRWRKVTLSETETTRRPSRPIQLSVPALFGGLAAVLFVVLAGNFGEVKLLFDQWAQRSPIVFESGVPGLARIASVVVGAWAWMAGQVSLDFPNDWWFWNASRVIPDTINEFPFFTFTYADLHAHMIVLPLTLLGLAAAVAIVRMVEISPLDQDPQRAERSPWYISLPELLLIGLLGLVVGALRATNTWDFPTYLLVGLSAFAVLEGARRVQLGLPEALDERLAFFFRAAVAVVWRMILLLVVATLAFYPFTRYYATAYAGLELWDGRTTSIGDYLVVHGFFLAIALVYLLGELWLQVRDAQVPEWLQDVLPFVVVAAAFVLAAGLVLHARIWLIALPLFTLALVLALGHDLPPTRRLALLLLALALAITMGVEVLRQRDDIGRMNTVFKFYVQAWVLFGVATAFGLASWARRVAGGLDEPEAQATWHVHGHRERRTWPAGLSNLLSAVFAVLFLGVMLYPPLAARAKVLDRFSAEAQPRGLDGMAYMDRAQYFDNNRDMRLADDKAAIMWMLQNVDGSPVILEGNTPGYRWGNRFSIYTGLPAVMGWDWHQRQQRSVVPGAAIDRRLAHVAEMYNTTDRLRVRRLLELYDVRYIIVGELERAYYAPEGLAKFDLLVESGYLNRVYDQGSVQIYEVRAAGEDPTEQPELQIVPTPTPLPVEARRAHAPQ